jgi:diguanylate cyclase (GGDEF)-like protein
MVLRAFYDPLTHLPNRVLFHKRVEDALRQSKEPGGGLFAVFLMDLDRFKQVNDRYGHWMGDRVLTIVSQRLRSCLRKGDLVARLGGDEFMGLMDRLRDPWEAVRQVETLLRSMRDTLQVDGALIRIGASLGLVYSTDLRDGTPDAYLRAADRAMYRAKEQGRDRFALFRG